MSELRCRGPVTLDRLVCAVRRPVRTVLLCVDWLAELNLVAAGEPGTLDCLGAHVQAPAKRPQAAPCDEGGRISRYIELASSREEPALLWGQRRLTPQSAVERALYIADQMRGPSGRIVFLGDDDLVSPLLAATAPGWTVTTIDIDSEVLSKAHQVASELGATVETRHADLSDFNEADGASYDIAVADPFPSGDGSFEALFWQRAAELLRRSGLLISTTSPSHKPIEYSRGALARLSDIGFALVDMRADFGRYEVFSFEFADYERQVLHRLGLRSTIAHTKSLFTATLTGAAAGDTAAHFDFGRWTEAAASHYLTRQAGLDGQIVLAERRGVASDMTVSVSERRNGLDISCALPPELAKRVSKATVVDTVRNLLRDGLTAAGIPVMVTEIEELASLWSGASVTSRDAPRLTLAVRALESWKRWRMDDH
ncbi:MAG TPA: bis-aminopropyl spermidine synthase family protein [Thermoanaerobaculia bacterium]|nr:bis-aminopropyl spermidine synthase family protein [Thermoanaerobaculia bacterium]